MMVEEENFATLLGDRAPRFRVGQRVRLSARGEEANIRPRTKRHDSGVVTRVDKYNSPSVLWDGLKHPQSYYAGFIALDRRRRTKP